MEINRISGIINGALVNPVVGPRPVISGAVGVVKNKELEKIKKTERKTGVSGAVTAQGGGRRMSDLQDAVELSAEAQSML